MKYSWLFLILVCAIFFSCNKEYITSQPADEIVQEGPIFTLTATMGNPDTRLSFDDDGLGTTWQPGDELYLVDLTGKNSTVTLTTDISSPSKKAAFKSGSSVLSGDYVVLYGTKTINQSGVSNTINNLTALNSQLRLYGSLSVMDGQTSANISLSHALAKLTIKFRNIPSGLTNMCCGMAACTKGTPIFRGSKISTEGWVSGSYVPTVSFSWNKGEDSYVLIPPEDYSDTKVYFYVYGDDSNGNHITYEFLKNGINIQAGFNYNITIDFSNATSQSSISCIYNSSRSQNEYQLSTPQDYRAAAYWNQRKFYSVSNDVSFSDNVFFPILAKALYGNGHVLTDVKIDLNKCNYVGIVSGYDNVVGTTVNGYVEGLILRESSITGKTYVGGIVGSGYTYQCGFEGVVTGDSQVGGLIGKWAGSLTNLCYVVGDVSGVSFVGGIVGSAYVSSDTNTHIMNSYFLGNVSGDTSVGGISGNAGSPYCCYTYGTVSTGYGIVGQGSCDVSKNLTSQNSMYYYSGTNDNCHCGPDKTFLSKLSVINGDEAFSTQVWSNIDAGCPLLQWQASAFGGDISAPGFGNVDW